jgi:ACS family D-galactonate transporter-like MFS transporter
MALLMNRRWIVLSLVFFGIVISYIDRGNLSIAAPSIMREFRIAPGAMGVLLSAFFWTYAAFQIPAGALVDRLGIRRAYAGGFLIWSIASASIALSRGTGDIIGLRMVLGFAESIGPLASLAFIRSHFAEEDRGLPTSIYIAGQSVGPALGALLGTILLERFGWRLMFAATGLGALLWLPCWLFAVPPDGKRAAGRAEQAVALPAAPVNRNWRTLVKSPSFWGLSICILLASYYWYFVLTWVPGYLVLSRGFSNLEMGRVISTGLFTMAASNVLTGYAADRLATRIGVFRIRLMFAAAGYAGTAAILLLLAVQDRTWVLPVFMCSMCATGTGNSNFWAIAQQVSPRHMTGRTIGYLNTLSQVAGAAAPIVTGWIAGPQKHFGPAIVVAGTCPVVAAVCLIAMGSKGLERMRALLAETL